MSVIIILTLLTCIHVVVQYMYMPLQKKPIVIFVCRGRVNFLRAIIIMDTTEQFHQITLWGAGMVEREHSPPTNVACVRIHLSALCGLSLLLVLATH